MDSRGVSFVGVFCSRYQAAVEFLRACLVAGVATLLCGGSTHAARALTQGAATEFPVVLTNALQVFELGLARGEALKLPVRLRGVVTVANPGRGAFFMEDETRGAMVILPATIAIPGVGAEVEVTGRTGGVVREWGVHADSVRIIGPGKVPMPRRITLSQAANVEFLACQVEVEGLIVGVDSEQEGGIVVELVDETGTSKVTINRRAARRLPQAWLGARVRLQGMNIEAPAPIVCMRPDQVMPVSDGYKSESEVPERTAADLRNEQQSLSFVKLTGVVLRVFEDEDFREVYLRSPAGAFRAQLQHATQAAGRPSTEQGSPLLMTLRRGDRIELLGPAVRNGSDVLVHRPVVRVIGAEEELPAVAASIDSLSEGAHADDLVFVRGRYIGGQEIPLGPQRFRDVIRLEAGGHQVSAALDSKMSGWFSMLKTDDLIEAVGVSQPSAGGRGALLRVASASEVRSLGLAPEVARLQLMRNSGVAVALLLLFGGRISWLRLSLARGRRILAERERADAAVREANASLERRVKERTIELENAQEEIARALEAERELSDMKTRFVSIVSHEFRTPLGIIMSAVELLRNYADRLPPQKQQELHSDIFSATRHMAGLMEQVLVLGRTESGRLAYSPAPLDLAVLCGKLADESQSATNQRCPIQVKLTGATDGASGDEALVRHILSNLLSNAVKYSPASASVNLEIARDGREAVFIVRDQGIGIPPDDLPHIFEAFHRAGNVGETPGTGLGMLIVKRCVELHGGTITVDSQAGRGTTVTVRLPLFNSPSLPPHGASSQP